MVCKTIAACGLTCGVLYFRGFIAGVLRASLSLFVYAVPNSFIAPSFLSSFLHHFSWLLRNVLRCSLPPASLNKRFLQIILSSEKSPLEPTHSLPFPSSSLLTAPHSRGYNIGQKLIDEFLAKSGVANCGNFREVAEAVAKVGFKMFLGVVVEVTSWNAEGTAFSLQVYENPLADYVELPPQYSGLVYSNLLCGVIRGALEMIKYRVECRFVKDGLKGEEVYEIRVELKQMVEESFGEEYNEGG